MERATRIVLGLDSPELTHEVMHFLDRTGRVRVVATAGGADELTRLVRLKEPEIVVAQPAMVRAGALNGSAFLAIDTQESVDALRQALDGHAWGFYVWPRDRTELAEAAAAVSRRAGQGGGKEALVVGVYGARGGVGTTFVATHLARAFAAREAETVLVDLDSAFADLTAALGAPAEESRTVADLAPVLGELDEAHLREAMWSHPSGFDVLLAPHDPTDRDRAGPSVYRAALEVLRVSVDVVVLHLPRSPDPLCRLGFELSDRQVVVLSLDVLAFRDALRILEILRAGGLEGRCEFVVNRAHRAEIVPRDVERVFGRPAAAVLGAVKGVTAAQDRGRLLPHRGRVPRALDRLAARLLVGRSDRGEKQL